MKNIEIIKKSEVIENNASIELDYVLDAFLSTKRSKNTQRAYASDLVSLFEYLKIRNTKELGEIAFHDLVGEIQSYLNSITKYNDKTNRPINPTST